MSAASLERWSSPRALGSNVLLALGTMNFGKRTPEPVARDIIARAREHGIDLLDTANAYVDGEAERIVGRAIAGRRDEFLIASKVGLGRVNGKPEGLSKDAIASACDASLARLGTDHIDVYYLHAPDPKTPIEETLAAIDSLLLSGKIRAWGISNFGSWQILEMFHLCEKGGLRRPVMSQVIYNLVVRQLDYEYAKFAIRYRLHTTIYNPLAGGLLTGRYLPGSQFQKGSRFDDNAMYRGRYWSDRMLTLAERYQKLAPQMSLVTLAYAFAASRPFVDSILVGPASLEHLDAAIQGTRTELAPDVAKQIDQVHREYLGTDATYAR